MAAPAFQRRESRAGLALPVSRVVAHPLEMIHVAAAASPRPVHGPSTSKRNGPIPARSSYGVCRRPGASRRHRLASGTKHDQGHRAQRTTPRRRHGSSFDRGRPRVVARRGERRPASDTICGQGHLETSPEPETSVLGRVRPPSLQGGGKQASAGHFDTTLIAGRAARCALRTPARNKQPAAPAAAALSLVNLTSIASNTHEAARRAARARRR